MTSRADIKLLSQLGQHYHVSGRADISQSEGSATPSVAVADATTATSTADNPTSSLAAALVTSTALFGVAVVAGVCAARSLDYRLKYDLAHRQVPNFDELRYVPTESVPILCVNMPQRHVVELAAAFNSHQEQGDGHGDRKSSAMFAPKRALVTLFGTAGGLNRGGGTSRGNTTDPSRSDANDDPGGLGGIKRGDSSTGGGKGQATGIASRFTDDCKARVLEAFSTLSSKQPEATQIVCLTEHFVVLFNGGEPDIFFTISDIVKRFKGQRITLMHCLALTVDGTNTKSFYSSLTGTVTQEWLHEIQGNSEALKEDFDEVKRLIPHEALFGPSEVTYCPTSNIIKPKSEKPNTEEAARLVHTSNDLDYVFYNRKVSQKVEAASTTASWLAAMVFQPSNIVERRTIVEQLFEQNVSKESRGCDIATVHLATPDSDAAVIPRGSHLFSPRFINYQRLSAYLQYGRQEDPEYYPMLSFISKLSRGWIAKDTTAVLDEESIDPQQLFTLSFAENHNRVGAGYVSGSKADPQQHTTATPQMRNMLTPVDMKRLRQWIDLEWAFTSKGWAVVRGQPSHGRLDAPTAPLAADIFFGGGKSEVDHQAQLAKLSTLPNSHLHACFVNLLEFHIQGADRIATVDRIRESFPTLFRQSIITYCCDAGKGDVAACRIQYNTAGHLADCTTAIIEQARILTLSGFKVRRAALGVLLRQGTVDFTAINRKDDRQLNSNSPLLPSFMIGLKALVSRGFVPLSVLSLSGTETKSQTDFKEFRSRYESETNSVLHAGQVGMCTSTSSHTVGGFNASPSAEGSLVSTPLLSPNNISSSTCSEYKFAHMASHYVSLHHPALRKRGLCPITDEDAKNPYFCLDQNQFVFEEFTTSGSSVASALATKATCYTGDVRTSAEGGLFIRTIPKGTGLKSAIRLANASKEGKAGQQLYYIVLDLGFQTYTADA